MRGVDRSRLPALKPDKPFHFPTFFRTRLANGLEVRTAPRQGLPVVMLIVLLPVGASADPLALPGLAQLTGDMLDEGSGDRSALEIHEEVARIGGELDIEVGPDATTLSLVTLSHHLERGVRLLADLTMRPTLAESDVDRVRALRLDRLAQLREVPPAIADRAFLGLLYGDHPYGHAAIGTEGSLRRVTKGDVRAFHSSRYLPEGATFIAGGDIDPGALVRMVEGLFGDWAGGPSDPPAADHANAAPAARPAVLAVVDRPGAAQSELRIGQIGPPRNTPDYAALLVLNTVLGGQFVSRVNLNLRERKGYTYGARTSFDFRKGPGPFLLQTAVDTPATADALREALGEITGIRGANPVTSDELAMGHAALTRGYPRSFETVGQITRGAAQLALYELPDNYFELFVPAILRIGIDDVTRAAQRHLDPAQLSTLIVGDAAVLGPSLREAGFDEPVVLSAGGDLEG